MKVLRSILLLTVAVVCLVFLGCNQGNDVTGKWKNTNLPETIEFKKDKSGIFTVQNAPSLPFKWKILGDGRIQLDINFMGTAKTLYGKLEKNTFVLIGNGEQAVYNRLD